MLLFCEKLVVLLVCLLRFLFVRVVCRLGRLCVHVRACAWYCAVCNLCGVVCSCSCKTQLNTPGVYIEQHYNIHLKVS